MWTCECVEYHSVDLWEQHWLSIAAFPGQYEANEMKSRQKAGEISKSGKKWLNWNNPKIEIRWGRIEEISRNLKESQMKAINL